MNLLTRVYLIAKRAVTRQCPICEEDIPIRLLGAHLDLESGRVDEIIQKIGSTEVLGEAEPDDGYVGILVSEVVMLNST